MPRGPGEVEAEQADVEARAENLWWPHLDRQAVFKSRRDGEEVGARWRGRLPVEGAGRPRSAISIIPPPANQRTVGLQRQAVTPSRRAGHEVGARRRRRLPVDIPSPANQRTVSL